MVDREARDKAAHLLQQLLQDGLISSSEFAETLAAARESQDTALKAICSTVWGAQGDMQTLSGSARGKDEGPGSPPLNVDGQALFERCALFLRSDLELGPDSGDMARFGLFEIGDVWPEARARRRLFRAVASLVLIGGVAAAFGLWGFSNRTAGLLMLWGLLWTLLFHFAEHVVCRPPEGWSIGTVFWPFDSRSDYERQLKRAEETADKR